MATTEVSSPLHGTIGTHGTSDSLGGITAFGYSIT
jgi:hypothetical protein